MNRIMSYTLTGLLAWPCLAQEATVEVIGNYLTINGVPVSTIGSGSLGSGAGGAGGQFEANDARAVDSSTGGGGGGLWQWQVGTVKQPFGQQTWLGDLIASHSATNPLYGVSSEASIEFKYSIKISANCNISLDGFSAGFSAGLSSELGREVNFTARMPIPPRTKLTATGYHKMSKAIFSEILFVATPPAYVLTPVYTVDNSSIDKTIGVHVDPSYSSM